jgi:hypothetical protein
MRGRMAFTVILSRVLSIPSEKKRVKCYQKLLTWLAVIIIPATALRRSTPNETSGVGDKFSYQWTVIPMVTNAEAASVANL